MIKEDLVLVDLGPMTLTVSAWQDGRARPVIAAKAARKAIFCLDILSEFQGYLKKLSKTLPENRPLPTVVKRAFDAVHSVSGELTPLAAVAGAVADEVAAHAAALKADKVIVNNGGDIAVIVKNKETAVVGLKPPHSDILIGQLHIDRESGVGGVASSGWSGRSFSSGAADMVTVWSENAAAADAAATFIAGKTSSFSTDIQQKKAVELDPFSDLEHNLVTDQVGRLTQKEKKDALMQGIRAAESLFKKNLIKGAFIYLQGNTASFDPFDIMQSMQQG